MRNYFLSASHCGIAFGNFCATAQVYLKCDEYRGEYRDGGHADGHGQRGGRRHGEIRRLVLQLEAVIAIFRQSVQLGLLHGRKLDSSNSSFTGRGAVPAATCRIKRETRSLVL